MHTFESRLHDRDKYSKPNKNLWSYQSITLNFIKIAHSNEPIIIQHAINEIRINARALYYTKQSATAPVFSNNKGNCVVFTTLFVLNNVYPLRHDASFYPLLVSFHLQITYRKMKTYK